MIVTSFQSKSQSSIQTTGANFSAFLKSGSLPDGYYYKDGVDYYVYRQKITYVGLNAYVVGQRGSLATSLGGQKVEWLKGLLIDPSFLRFTSPEAALNSVRIKQYGRLPKHRHTTIDFYSESGKWLYQLTLPGFKKDYITLQAPRIGPGTGYFALQLRLN